MTRSRPAVADGNRGVDGKALDTVCDGSDGPEVAFGTYYAVQIIAGLEVDR